MQPLHAPPGFVQTRLGPSVLLLYSPHPRPPESRGPPGPPHWAKAPLVCHPTPPGLWLPGTWTSITTSLTPALPPMSGRYGSVVKHDVSVSIWSWIDLGSWVVASRASFGVKLQGLIHSFPHWPCVLSWIGYLTSVGLSFLISIMGIKYYLPQGAKGFICPMNSYVLWVENSFWHLVSVLCMLDTMMWILSLPAGKTHERGLI